MTTFASRGLFVFTAVLTLPLFAFAQVPPFDHKVITPEKLGLPANNARTSEPYERVYKTDDKGKILKEQPANEDYPFRLTEGYKLKANEKTRWHEGVDMSTRVKGKNSSTAMDYKAGVNGEVIQPGGGTYNTIRIKLQDGSVLEYLHSSKVYVKKGEQVTPETVIAKSGSVGAGAIHIHIQAKDKDDNVMHPDKAFQIGEQKETAAPARGGLGGVLVNPTAKKEGPPLKPDQGKSILGQRPDEKAAKWTIKLPKGTDSDGKDK